MTAVTYAMRRIRLSDLRAPAPLLVAGPAFLVLFWQPLTTVARDWWIDPDSAHGLLLFPVAVYLMWRRGRAEGARPQPLLGLMVLVASVVLRYLSGLAAELFTMRLSVLGAVLGLTIFWLGLRQVLHWWLPLALLGLSIPLPDVLTGTLALPLQRKASELGAMMLSLRHVPVRLAGNVLYLPGRSLFVTEACSGLRSLTALLALGLMIGGIWLRSWWGRTALVLAAIPVAVALNGVRVFLTGFLMFFVNPALGQGVMHYSEGWVIFVAAFAILGGVAWVLGAAERRLRTRA